MVVKEFSGVARFDQAGELICFCYEADVEAGRCTCIGKHPCCQANFSIEVVRNLETPAEKVEHSLDKLHNTSKVIKAGLKDLEQAVRKNKFRL